MSDEQDRLRAKAVASIAGSAEAFESHWLVKASFRCQQEWQGGKTAEQWWPVSEDEFHAMIREAFTAQPIGDAALRAHVERLREALEGMRVAYHNLWDRCVSSGAFVRVGNVHDLSALKVCQAALAATPAQSLADVERRVVERCASIARQAWEQGGGTKQGDWARCANTIYQSIRALAPEVTP